MMGKNASATIAAAVAQASRINANLMLSTAVRTGNLAEVARRKIQGSFAMSNPTAVTTWTPSAADKVYQHTDATTQRLHNGTWVVLGEGQGIVKANFKGSYFEAWSAKKFTVCMTQFQCDKDDAVASSEAAWSNYSDPKSMVLSHHTDVINMGKTISVAAKPIESSLWYVRIQTSRIFNDIVKDYARQFPKGFIRDASKLNSEPFEGYLETLIIGFDTTPIYYGHRLTCEVITAQADQ